MTRPFCRSVGGCCKECHINVVIKLLCSGWHLNDPKKPLTVDKEIARCTKYQMPCWSRVEMYCTFSNDEFGWRCRYSV